MASPRLVWWCAPFALALSAPTASAQWLSTYSPFRPPAGPDAAVAPAETRFEYLGFARLPEGDVFRVVDRLKKTASFLRLNERDAEMGVVAREFNAATDVLVIEHDGRRMALVERRGKIRPAGAGAPGIPPAVIQAAVVSPTPQQEVERLEAIRRDVITRRAQREQAAAQAASAAK